MAAGDDLLTDPIVILGAPRSGTAILAQVLSAHPDLVYVREPRLAWRYGNDGKSDMLSPDDATAEVRRHIRAFFEEAVRTGGGRRLLEKTPSNALRPAFVDRVLPDARFLHIVRDGLDCVAAIHRAWLEPPADLRASRQRNRLRRHLREADWRRAPRYATELVQKLAPASFAPVVGRRPWGPRLPGLNGLLKDLELLDVCSLQWRMCVEAAGWYGRRLPPDRYLECRVEDLDGEMLERILHFCGLDAHHRVLDTHASAYDRDRIRSHGDELGPAARDRVLAWIEPTMQWLNQRSAPPPVEEESVVNTRTDGDRLR